MRAVRTQADLDELCRELTGLASDELIASVNRVWDRTTGRYERRIRNMIGDLSLSDRTSGLLMDIVMARKRAGGKYRDVSNLFFTAEGLRWATPESAAEHCAVRMAGPISVDVTCGLGGLLMSLSGHCDEVIGFELDPLNGLMASLNMRLSGRSEHTILLGDCLGTEAVAASGSDIHVFCDPARPPGSVERTMGELRPNPMDVMAAYGEGCTGFCFEVPPYMSLEKVPFEHEAEYVSLDGRLNRLDLYTGDLIKGKRSAVVLPGGDSISGDPIPAPRESVELPSKDVLLYEVDSAVIRAGLVGNIIPQEARDARIMRLDSRRTLISSRREISSPFFTHRYGLIACCGDIKELITILKDHGVGSTTIRWSVDPKEYWNVRNEIQRDLHGTRKVHLFRWNGYMAAEPLPPKGGSK